MSCKNCGTWGNDNTDTRMPCRVCELVDKDSSVKRVKWCDDCSAHICEACWHDIPRRGIAFAKNVIEKVVEVLKPKAKVKKDFPTDEFSKVDEKIISKDGAL